MLGIIGGTSLLFSDLRRLEKRRVATPFGPAEVHAGEDVALLMRHQYGLPPHRINFRACISALAILGVDRVISIGSVGSLQKYLTPGSMIIPSDYLSLSDIPSIHDCAIEHVMPEMDASLIRELARLVPEAQAGGIYVQTHGPRIETMAEVQAITRIGDVVGMTVASEATLAKELDIPFASLAMVDNYAHGLGGDPLSYEHILATAQEHKNRTENIIRDIVENLA